MLKKVAFIFFALPFCMRFVYAQNTLVNISAKLNSYNQQNYREKVFLHTDQNMYVTGELLWFKAYIINDTTNRKSNLSNIAYLEVLDNNQKPILQTKIPVYNGSGSGSIFLPVSLHSGNYKLRAYTRWMKNFDAVLYFEKDISIINSLQESEPAKKDNAALYDIQFFPEGGNLVSGLENKVAFKATGRNGKGIEFYGSLINASNTVVATFKPLKFGIGCFNFTPQANQVYKAKIKLANGQELVTAFTAAVNDGYAMRVTDTTTNSLSISIKSNIAGTGNVYLVACTHGQYKLTQTAQLQNGKAGFLLNRAKLGDGISCLTIFNDVMKPVAERLYFKRPKQKMLLNIKTMPQYPSRKKVTLNIGANNETGKALAADMSVAVFNADSLSANNNANIFSYLWLASDLKGNIESPEYYLATETPEADRALDNLMLTHGWRKFKWDEALEKKPAAFKYEPEYEINIISGKVINKNTGKPAPNIVASLAVIGADNQLYGAKSDTDGRITFYTKYIYSAVKAVVQTVNPQDSVYRIMLDNPFSATYSNNLFPTFQTIQNGNNYLLNHSIAMQVQNLYSAARLKKFSATYADTTAFYGDASDKKYLLDLYTRFPTMHEVLSEYVEEVFIKEQGSHYRLTTYNVKNKRYMENPPLVLLDGVPVYNPDKIINYNPLNVKELDIVAKDYYLGPLTFGGIINFSTYKKNLNGFELDPNATVVEYAGLQLQREFYSPVYDTQQSVESRLPDFRNLLYWSPNVKTGADGTNQLEFYTSDRKGKYIVVLQGISEDGRPGYQTGTFEVVK